MSWPEVKKIQEGCQNHILITQNTTWIVPFGVSQIKISACAAGEDGSPTDPTYSAKAGEAIFEKVFNVVGGMQIPITVGTGNTIIGTLQTLVKGVLADNYPNSKFGNSVGFSGYGGGGGSAGLCGSGDAGGDSSAVAGDNNGLGGGGGNAHNNAAYGGAGGAGGRGGNGGYGGYFGIGGNGAGGGGGGGGAPGYWAPNGFYAYTYSSWGGSGGSSMTRGTTPDYRDSTPSIATPTKKPKVISQGICIDISSGSGEHGIFANSNDRNNMIRPDGGSGANATPAFGFGSGGGSCGGHGSDGTTRSEWPAGLGANGGSASAGAPGMVYIEW